MPNEPIWKWFFGALAVGFLCLAGAALGRTVYTIRQYGLLAYLRSTFRVEPENFRLIAVLLLLAIAMMLMYTRGGG